MPTIISKTIGSSGRDYTTPQAWLNDTAAVPVNLVSGDVACVGLMENDSEFILPDIGGGVGVHFTGHTTDATHTITLTTNTGQSFRDNPSSIGAYVAAQGVGLRNTAALGTGLIQINDSNVILDGLQLKAGNDGVCVYDLAASGTIVRNCILEISNTTGYNVVVMSAMTLINCLLIKTAASGKYIAAFAGTGPNGFVDCTIVQCSGIDPSINNWAEFDSGTFGALQNLAIFGVPSATIGGSAYTTTMTDATLLAGGTGIVASLTYANQFIDNTVSTHNFRVKSGADLINAGTAVGGITTDAFKVTRSVSTPTIGASEFTATSSTPTYLYFGQATMMMGEALVWGAGAKFASDLIRNPVRSRRRLLTWRDDK